MNTQQLIAHSVQSVANSTAIIRCAHSGMLSAQQVRVAVRCFSCGQRVTVSQEADYTYSAYSERTVAAEKVPVGVLIHPVASPIYAENFTLAEVNVYLTESREVRVEWLYQNGNRRNFAVGEEVVIQASA